MDELVQSTSPEGRAPISDLSDLIRHHLIFTVGESPENASVSNWRVALSHTIRDRVVTPWFKSGQRVNAANHKRVYYLSMEFLIGRILEDAIVNLGLEDETHKALEELGLNYEQVLDDEPDAALGNGGLGRLAACFMDSMSTVGVPAFGYGIRYHHGLFKQNFDNGWQVEAAEDWLIQGHPWEFERTNAIIPIGFGGSVEDKGNGRAHWSPAETVLACAYDTPTPGWRGEFVNTLRLWNAQATEVFDLEPFNRGDFIGAAASNVVAETISRVLYPDDTTPAGKELRLKQEFFFTAASLRDLIARAARNNRDLRELPSVAAIQLNDTHPAIAGPELVRLLLDEHGFSFEDAFDTARQCLNYTNHTLMPEALEKWPVDMIAQTLPRHMQLIERMDHAHKNEVKALGKERTAASAIIHDGHVQMGNLAFVGARHVNGVSGLHTDLMRTSVFAELHDTYPHKILSQTNGVTPRRWIKSCNPALSDLLTATIGDGWQTDLERLSALKQHAEDRGFRDAFLAAKKQNKARLANMLQDRTGISVDTDAMFDIQIKRIHEYKRQLMNILEAAALWNEMCRDPGRNWPKRVRVFGGKAAPGYAMAKQIIKLINDIGEVINNDPRTQGRLQIVYPANYNVSMAEVIIPGADLSEQISTAGMEASGTGNMKLSMNGALTIGTLDGANVEIRNHVGDENIFIFGQTADQVQATRKAGYDPSAAIAASPLLSEVVHQIESGVFSPDDAGRHHGLIDNLKHHDWFMVAQDFQSYFDKQRDVDELWHDQDEWTRRAILNTAAMGWFSSDRTIRGYAAEIWDVAPII